MAGPDKKKIINFDLTGERANKANSQELQFDGISKRSNGAQSSRTQKGNNISTSKTAVAKNVERKKLNTEHIKRLDESSVIAFESALRNKKKTNSSSKSGAVKSNSSKDNNATGNLKKRPEKDASAKRPNAEQKIKKRAVKNNSSEAKTQPQKNKQGRTNNNSKAEKSKKNKGKLKRIMIFVLTLIFISMIVFFAYWFVRADEITVSGNKDISADDIITLSGLSKGDHFFTIDRAAVENGIEASPRLEFLGIDFELPGKLTLKVKERTPAAQFKVEDGCYVVIDSEATAIDDPAVLQELPLITGISLTDYSLAYAVRTDDNAKLEELKLLLSELEAHYLTDDISDIDISNPSSVALTTTTGMQVYLGEISAKEDLCRQMTWIQSVLPELINSGYEKGKLNVTSDEQATFEPESGQDSEDAQVILSEIGQAVEPQH